MGKLLDALTGGKVQVPVNQVKDPKFFKKDPPPAHVKKK